MPRATLRPRRAAPADLAASAKFVGSAVLALAAAAAAQPSAAAPGPSETAEYVVVFDATWSAESHPDEFPAGAHFSPLIGGTHDGGTHLWREGELATLGIERMAETGSKTVLRNEVLALVDAGRAGTVIEDAAGIASPGRASTSFIVTTDFPYATVVTMIAPSPDWFVGVDGLRLLVEGTWVDELVIELPPYDAGTDSGVTYSSPNEDTQPPEPIAEITGPPLYNEKEQRVPPLGTFTFRRLDVTACPADVDGDDHVDFADLVALLAAWGAYEPCPPHVPEDVDRDCTTGFSDLLALLAAWGPCAE